MEAIKIWNPGGRSIERDKISRKYNVRKEVDLKISEVLQNDIVKIPHINSWNQNKTEQIKIENQEKVIIVKSEKEVFEMNKVDDLQYDAWGDSNMQIQAEEADQNKI